MKSRVFRQLNVFLLPVICGFLIACNTQPSQRSQSGQCPQIRATEYAPAAMAAKQNPLSTNQENADAGKKLYQSSASPVACAQCHGENGDGNGIMAKMFEPSPRNFTCSEVVGELSDGQLFWIIKNGSIGTSMPAFDKLTEKQIWQLTLYLRTFEIKPAPVNNTRSGKLQTSPAQASL